MPLCPPPSVHTDHGGSGCVGCVGEAGVDDGEGGVGQGGSTGGAQGGADGEGGGHAPYTLKRAMAASSELLRASSCPIGCVQICATRPSLMIRASRAARSSSA